MKYHGQLLSLILVVLFSWSSTAQHERWVASARGDGGNTLPAGETALEQDAWLEVHDPEYNYVSSNQASFQNRFVYESAEAHIVLRYEDSERLFINVPRSWEIDYELSYRTVATINNPTPLTFNGTLHVDHVPQGGEYRDIHVDVIPDAVWAFVRITDIDYQIGNPPTTSLDPLPEDLYFDVIIDVERRYVLDPPEAPQFTSRTYTPTGPVGAEFVTLNWDYVEGATSYDLEWVFIDNPTTTVNSSWDGEYDMQTATRINTGDNSYTIPLAYPKGVILARIRGVGEFTADGTRLEGTWSGAVNPTGLADDYGMPLFWIDVDGLEPSMNWQYTGAYAEGGLRKDLINYFDAGLKSRQSLTLLNTDELTVLSDNVYDHVGRPSLQLLPYPEEGRSLSFHPDRLGAGATYFDKEDFDQVTNLTDDNLIPNAGAGTFYSSNNPGVGFYGELAPDAQGLPYSKSLYMDDGSGRVRESSGPGPQHSLESGHTTRHFYGTPASQFELDRLFGSEVGYVEHYKKTASMDPNGVTSVTYTDQHGRTIATALAGPAPSNMEQIDTYVGPPVDISSDLTQFNQRQGDSWNVSHTVVIPNSSALTIDYTLSQDQLDLCIEWDCKYDLTICLYDAISNDPIDIVGPPTSSPVCYESSSPLGISELVTPGFSYTTPTPLPAGSYRIEKILTLNQANLDDIEAQLLSDWSPYNGADPCPELVTVPEVPCDCETMCEQTFITDDGNGNPVYFDLNGSVIINPDPAMLLVIDGYITDCKAECDPTLEAPDPCEIKRNLMREDMSPGGQYFDNTPFEFNPNGTPNTLYDIDGWWDLQVPDPFASGGNLHGILPGLPSISVTSAVDIRNNWPTDPNDEALLLDLLVKEHPEYCRYEMYCESECYGENNGLQLTGEAFYGSYYQAMYAETDIAFDPNAIRSEWYYNPLNAATDNNTGNPSSYQPFTIASDPADVDQLINCWMQEYPLPAGACGADMTPTWNLNNFLEIESTIPPTYATIWYVLEDPLNIHEQTTLAAAQSVSGILNLTNDAYLYFQALHGVGPYDPGGALVWSPSVTGYLAADHLTPYQWFRAQYDFFREFYAYSDCLGFNGCSDPKIPTANGGVFTADGFMVHYPTNIIYDNYTPGSGVNHAVVASTSQYNQCGAVCEDVALGIAMSFEQCLIDAAVTYSQSDIIKLQNDLIAVCTDDCGNNPTGSSQAPGLVTLPSGYTNTSGNSEAQTFDDVIDIYNALYPPTCGYPPSHPLPDPPAGEACPCGNIEDLLAILQLNWGDATDALTLAQAINAMDGAPDPAISDQDLRDDLLAWMDICDGTTPIVNSITDDLDAAGLIDLFDCPDALDPEDCATAAYAQALVDAQILNQQIIQAFVANYMASYKDHCLEGLDGREIFEMSYQLDEYHYTLYYYDQAGNLIKTVPPAGVNLVIADYMEDDGVSPPAAPTTPYSDQTGLETAIAENRAIPDDLGTYPLIRPDHQMVTWYNYNSFQQVHLARTPDGGHARSWYDTEGRVVASQHDEQVTNDEYAYTRYDALGRTIESGQLKVPVPVNMYDVALGRDINYSGGFEDYYANAGVIEPRDITRTYYQVPFDPVNVSPQFSVNGPQNLRGRIATVTRSEEPSFPLNDLDYDQASHYSYDIHGNVDVLIQEISELHPIGQGFKKVKYDYDLITGNVNKVHYQDEQWDEYHHRYTYDADNRLLEVETSDDEVVWERDARYFYYAHGPLARNELGAKSVQGLDHYYTLHGWQKGVNSPGQQVDDDPGIDAGDVSELNHQFARDNYSYNLFYYYDDTNPLNPVMDYKSVSGTDPSMQFDTNGNWKEHFDFPPNTYSLFNGNIAGMIVSLYGNDGAKITARANAYIYDVLNRIRNQKTYDDGSQSDNLFAVQSGSSNAHKTEYHYDANGNFTTLLRNQATGSTQDNLEYFYFDESNSNVYAGSSYNQAGRSNKLALVHENAPVTPLNTSDIEIQTVNPYNYYYDNIGRLIQDESASIPFGGIEWNLSNKIDRIQRNGPNPYNPNNYDPNMEFRYDAYGNRTVKIVKPRSATGVSSQLDWTYTYYVRDAQGNPLAIYDRKFTNISAGNYQDALYLDEHIIYGSDRLGVRKPLLSLSYDFNNPSPGSNTYGEVLETEGATYTTLPLSTLSEAELSRELDQKRYELTNHLGNVLSVVSDRRVAIDADLNGLLDNYQALQYSYSDYYPFGSLLPGRHEASTDPHRFGFNGMEMDDEVHSSTGTNYTTTWRVYDPRIGRWFSRDPMSRLLPMESPYAFSGNNPIFGNDPDGDLCVPCLQFLIGFALDVVEQMADNLIKGESFGVAWDHVSLWRAGIAGGLSTFNPGALTARIASSPIIRRATTELIEALVDASQTVMNSMFAGEELNLYDIYFDAFFGPAARNVSRTLVPKFNTGSLDRKIKQQTGVVDRQSRITSPNSSQSRISKLEMEQNRLQNLNDRKTILHSTQEQIQSTVIKKSLKQATISLSPTEEIKSGLQGTSGTTTSSAEERASKMTTVRSMEF